MYDTVQQYVFLDHLTIDKMRNSTIWLCFLLFVVSLLNVEGTTVNVKDFGVKGDGKTDDSQAFLKAWKAACAAAGTVKLLVPKATYLVGPLAFQGPCKSSSLIFQMEGHLKATEDLTKYPSDSWVKFTSVDYMTLTGGGTFDGQGASAWPHNECPKNAKCHILPMNLFFLNCETTVVSGITSLNSKFFHMAIVSCNHFRADNIKITAPGDSPNTDGIHVTRSTDVKILSSNIGTGDDCVSVGDSVNGLTISNINCGPGHGISVGSLGRYGNEGDVQNIVVKDSTLTGTMWGARIKTWQDSPKATTASNITFSNLIMNNVGSPIIVDQKYCPFASCSHKTPSKVKLVGITFDGIRGTSNTKVAVKIICSKGYPCQNVKLNNINIKSSGSEAITSNCESVKPIYSGTQSPSPCK